MTKESVGHVMTGIMCACALLMTGLVVRQQMFPTAAAATTLPTHIKNWTDFRSGQVLGAPNRQVSLVVFSDYECPACRAFSKVVDSLRLKYPKTLSVYYRHLPIPSHPYGRPAALASECAAVQGHFAEAHKLLFADPDSIGIRPWADFAMQAGVRDVGAFNACMRDSSQVGVVQRDEAAAQRLGITGTPTLLLGDQLIGGSRTFNQMDQLIRRQIKN